MAGVSEDADCVQAIARYPDAAAKVLGEQGKPMNCQEMIDAMAAKGYWTSPGGKTPSATLYSAILRELKTKRGLGYHSDRQQRKNVGHADGKGPKGPEGPQRMRHKARA